ncbi:MAG: hypothetical protein O4861_20545 [Trichodesmium sp. St16_bin4-tuft]|nr:hypothetical protein [Trichodesmium sp. St4_bin8_1]MDE5073810.1 hypothetical protein [Trichodesmium sp. St5_bin8]MDE5100592.1 hypothetical protein [Trichodesmium sp. St16_bin4-tuft]MDE5101472.1 hypothetical protein [Trichodesmium sp. St19_bin2]
MSKSIFKNLRKNATAIARQKLQQLIIPQNTKLLEFIRFPKLKTLTRSVILEISLTFAVNSH